LSIKGDGISLGSFLSPSAKKIHKPKKETRELKTFTTHLTTPKLRQGQHRCVYIYGVKPINSHTYIHMDIPM
jgi:hypothetical protein